jgi:hypothetical protein
MTNPVEIFTIRLWREKLDERESEWRGRVQHIGSGQARYFNEIGKIMEFIGDHLSKEKTETQSAPTASMHAAKPRIHYPLKQRARRGSRWLEKRPERGSQPSRHIASNSPSNPLNARGGDRQLSQQIRDWIKSRLFPLKKPLIILFTILLFVGDWFQVSWLGPRLHSLIAFGPETFFVGLVSLPRSLRLNGFKLKASGRKKRIFQLRRKRID